MRGCLGSHDATQASNSSTHDCTVQPLAVGRDSIIAVSAKITCDDVLRVATERAVVHPALLLVGELFVERVVGCVPQSHFVVGRSRRQQPVDIHFLAAIIMREVTRL